MYQKKPKNNLNSEQVNFLIKKVSDYFYLPSEDVVSKCRKDELVNARMFICALLKYEHKMTLKKIGEHLSGRDHSTIVYMLSEYNNLCKSKVKIIREETSKTFVDLLSITNKK